MTRLSPADLAHPTVCIATGFGVGFAPWAPGTIGSLAALPIWWYGLSHLDLLPLLGALAVSTAIGVYCAHSSCRIAAVDDDQAIVIDEWLGMWVALLAAPRSIVSMLAAFALFRLFDIVKPWPVSWADRAVPGGLGVVLDDLLAGLLAFVVLQLSIFALVGILPGLEPLS